MPMLELSWVFVAAAIGLMLVLVIRRFKNARLDGALKTRLERQKEIWQMNQSARRQF